MSERSPSELVGGGLLTISLVAALVELGYKPFLFGPISLLALAIGILVSGRFKRFATVVALLLTLCFVIGAAVAVWESRSLY